MAPLDTILAEMDQILTQYNGTHHLTGAERAKLVMEARSRMVTQLAALNGAIAEDAQLRASPDLARDFADRFAALRTKLAEFQVKWRATDLAERGDGFQVDSTPLAGAFIDFVKWARRSRAAA